VFRARGCPDRRSSSRLRPVRKERSSRNEPAAASRSEARIRRRTKGREHPRPFVIRACEWSVFPVCSAIIDRIPDYELDDVLTVEDPKQLRALADPLRAKIITLLRQRAASTTELAGVLGTPKGTVGHHLKVLEKAGLIRVVRTRKVRALTEKFYGRVARLFVLKGTDTAPDDLRGGALTALMLRQAADEAIASGGVEKDLSALVHVRLAPKDLARFQRRVNRLVADLHGSEDPDGDMHALACALFPSTVVLPPRAPDA
jgi:DNA-binding transcriptional ArsR family regulator